VNMKLSDTVGEKKVQGRVRKLQTLFCENAEGYTSPVRLITIFGIN